MKQVACKRCGVQGLIWYQDGLGKWTLTTPSGVKHCCDDGNLKSVKCKYCSADDLHWAEDIDPITKAKKVVLTESYGLPHACDERIASLSKQKQEKKNTYEVAKKRIVDEPNGVCSKCNGVGRDTAAANGWSSCKHCMGWGKFDPKSKRDILASIRQTIWPNMPNNYR